MAKDLLYTVNFGTSKAGLSSVGYTLYRTNGTPLSSRSNSGVVEFGSSGVYGAVISRPDEDVLVLWDSGEAVPKYGSEDSRVQIDGIASDTEKIKTIWNSLKNQGEFFAALMDKLGILEKNKGLTQPDVREVVADEVAKIKIPEVKIPEFPSIPDNSKEFEAIKSALGKSWDSLQSVPRDRPDMTPILEKLDGIKGDLVSIPRENISDVLKKLSKDVSKIPTESVEYSKEFDSLQEILSDMMSVLSDKAEAKDVKDLKSVSGLLLKYQDYFKSVKEVFSRFDSLVSDIAKYNESMKAASGDALKKAESSREKIEAKIQKMHSLLKIMAQKDGVMFYPDKEELMMALGHKR